MNTQILQISFRISGKVDKVVHCFVSFDGEISAEKVNALETLALKKVHKKYSSKTFKVEPLRTPNGTHIQLSSDGIILFD